MRRIALLSCDKAIGASCAPGTDKRLGKAGERVALCVLHEQNVNAGRQAPWDKISPRKQSGGPAVRVQNKRNGRLWYGTVQTEQTAACFSPGAGGDSSCAGPASRGQRPVLCGRLPTGPCPVQCILKKLRNLHEKTGMFYEKPFLLTAQRYGIL